MKAAKHLQMVCLHPGGCKSACQHGLQRWHCFMHILSDCPKIAQMLLILMHAFEPSVSDTSCTHSPYTVEHARTWAARLGGPGRAAAAVAAVAVGVHAVVQQPVVAQLAVRGAVKEDRAAARLLHITPM